MPAAIDRRPHRYYEGPNYTTRVRFKAINLYYIVKYSSVAIIHDHEDIILLRYVSKLLEFDYGLKIVSLLHGPASALDRRCDRYEWALNTGGHMMAIREEKAAATAAHARALEPVICRFAAAGITSLAGIARGLNDGGYPAIQGGPWMSTQVEHLLRRLGIVLKPPMLSTKTASAARRAAATRALADARARVIAEISESGVVSFADIARRLNGRGVTTRQGNVWDGAQVRRVMLRLGLR